MTDEYKPESLLAWFENPLLKCGQDIVYLVGADEANRILGAAVEQGILKALGRSQLATTHHPEHLYVQAIYQNRYVP